MRKRVQYRQFNSLQRGKIGKLQWTLHFLHQRWRSPSDENDKGRAIYAAAMYNWFFDDWIVMRNWFRTHTDIVTRLTGPRVSRFNQDMQPTHQRFSVIYYWTADCLDIYTLTLDVTIKQQDSTIKSDGSANPSGRVDNLIHPPTSFGSWIVRFLLI